MRNPLYESYPSHQSLRKKGLMLKKGRVRRNWKTREFEFDVTKGDVYKIHTPLEINKCYQTTIRKSSRS